MGSIPVILIVAGAIVVLGLVAVALGLRAARRRWRRGPELVGTARQHAVVLVHGLLGFDRVEVMGRPQHYFRGIGEHLVSEGAEVFAPRLAPLGSVPERAAALTDYLAEIDARRAIVIGHSLGGLDARYALSRCGLDQRVAALITIGTPHRGTWIAGLADLVPARLLRGVLGHLGMRSDALAWLTEERAERLSRDLVDAPSVFYGSIVGRASRSQLLVNPPLLACYEVLRYQRGDNDGLVPAISQQWGRVMADVRADHWAQIGWSRGFDARYLYATVLRELEKQGIHCLSGRRIVAAAS